MPNSGEVVWIDVLPSLRGFSASLAKEAAGASRRAGQELESALDTAAKRAGASAGRSISTGLEQAQARAEKLGTSLAQARDKEADAAGRVRVAEQKLLELRDNENAKTSQLVAAEERLESAKRSLSGAQTRATATADQYSQAQRNSRVATDELTLSGGRGAGAMGLLERGTNGMLTQLARVSPQMALVRDGFRTGASAAEGLTGPAARAGAGLRTVVDHASNVGAGFVRMADISSGATDRIGSSITRSITAPLRGAGTLLASYGISAGSAFALAGGAAVTAGIKFNASQEQATTAFTNMLKSGQAARDFMGQLTKFAAATPFDLPNVVTGAQRLMAFGWAAKDVIPTLTAIGDAVAGMGGGAEQVDRVTLAIGQMSAKGKVQSDEILQLTEAGIPALAILANRMHVNTGQLQEMITKGLVPAGPAIKDLLAGIEQGTDGAAGKTTAFAGLMEQQSHTMVGVWSNFKDNLNRTLGDLVAPAMPALKAALGGLTDAMAGAPAFFAHIATEGAPAWNLLRDTWRDVSAFVTGSLIPALLNVWNAIQPVAVIVGGALLGALRAAGAVLRDVIGPVLVTVTSWLRPLMPVIVGITAAFLAWWAIGAAVMAVTKAITLVRAGILAVRIAWMLLSLAFTASPIGFIIALIAGLVVGIIYAWTHFQGFRNVVMAVWHAIVAAAQWAWGIMKIVWDAIVVAIQAVGGFFAMLWRGVVTAWNAIVGALVAAWNFMRPIFEAIWHIIEFVGQILYYVLVVPWLIAIGLLIIAVTWFWNNVLKPVFDGIAAVATWLWNTVLAPIFGFIGAVWGALMTGMAWVWGNVLKPAWDAIVIAATWLWNNVLAPIFGFIGWYWSTLLAGMVWVWNNVLRPAWDALVVAAQFLWNNVLSPIFGWIGDRFRDVGSAIGWVWENVIKKAWEGIRDIIQWVWDNVISKIFGWIGDRARDVGAAFEAMGRTIGGIWDGLKRLVHDGIQAVVDLVWNNGLLGMWRAANDSVLGGVIPDPPGPWIVPNFVAGGPVTGPGSASSDSIPALLSNGEFVINAAAARLWLPLLELLNAQHFARGGLVGYAEGGTVAGAAAGATAVATVTTADPSGATAAMDAATLATQALTAAAQTLADVTNTIIVPALNLWASTTSLVVTPALDALTFAVNIFLIPALTALTNYINLAVMLALLALATFANLTLTPALVWIATNVNTVLVPAFSGLKDEIDLTLIPALQRAEGHIGTDLPNYLGTLREGLRLTRDAIGETAAWTQARFAEMQGYAGGPVRWILQWPMNAGLVAAWNKLDADFALNKHIADVPIPFAVGGRVPGAGNRDTVPAWLMPGEYVWSKQAVANLGGASTMDELHRRARVGRMRDEGIEPRAYRPGLHFAYGGVVPQVAAAGDELSRVLGPYSSIGGVAARSGHSDHPFGYALDFMTLGNFGLGDRTASYLQANAKRLAVKYLIWMRKFNQGAGWVPYTGPNPHTDHVHASFLGGPLGDEGSSFGGTGTGGASFFDPAAVVDPVFAATYSMIDDITKYFAGQTTAIQGQGIVRQAADRIKAIAVEKISATSGLSTPAIGGDARAAQDYAASILGRFGWGQDQMAPLIALWNKESNWLWWKVNAASGATGIPQALPGSKMASAGPDWKTNPSTQINWGLGYIKDRYDTPAGAWGFHKAHNWYDEGGWLQPGFTPVYNGTGKPELVLPHETASDVIGALNTRNEQPIVINVYPQPGQSEQAISEMVSRRLKMANRT